MDVTEFGEQMRQRSDGAETREKIIRAAIVEFADRGFDEASIRTIANRAGVDSALVNRYFGPKADLLEATLATIRDTHVASIHRRLETVDAHDIAQTLVDGAIGELADPVAMRLFVRCSVKSPATSFLHAEIIEPGIATLSERLTGEHTRERAELISMILIGAATTRLVRTEAGADTRLEPAAVVRLIEPLVAGENLP